MTLILNGTTGEVFPTWTTAGRPASPSTGQTGFNTTTGQLETYNGTGWRISAGTSTQGNSGQYLQSAGASSPPVWADFSATSGTLIRAPQMLISGTSYTTPAGCTKIYVEMVGGGGGGAGTNSTNQTGGCGGGGGYLTQTITVTALTAYTYAIGAAGSAGASNANGGTGGNTTLTVGATTYTSSGGGGGTNTGTGGSGGTTTNGDTYSFTGMAGDNISGRGGSPSVLNFIGFTGRRSTAPSSGTAGTNYGCGGGGGASTTGSQTGGAGSQGFIRIWEYT